MKISLKSSLAALIALSCVASAVPTIEYVDDSTDLVKAANTQKKGRVARVSISIPALQEKAVGSPTQIVDMLNRQIKQQTGKEETNVSEDNGSENAVLNRILNDTIYQVIVMDYNGYVYSCGSSSCIDPSGVFITNHHVAEDITQPKYTYYLVGTNGTAYKVDECPYMNKTQDLALLCVEAKNLPYLKVNPNYAPQGGEKCVTKGYPNAMSTNSWVDKPNTERQRASLAKFLLKYYPDPRFTEGVISSVSMTMGSETIHHQVPISSGSSGSPLVNSEGELIGVNRSMYIDNGGAKVQNMNMATKISELGKHISDIRSEKARKAVERIFAGEKK